MACNGLNLGRLTTGNNSCMWTLIVIAIVLVWINCGCGNDC
ncbi:MAG: hypothetical protein VB111_09770 [Clostridiaceae bacterium]|nr:hypothetical protein [Clostridiaceae bacterium]